MLEGAGESGSARNYYIPGRYVNLEKEKVFRKRVSSTGDVYFEEGNKIKEDIALEHIKLLEKEGIRHMTKEKKYFLLLIEMQKIDEFIKLIGEHKQMIDAEYFYEAVLSGNLDMVKWLFENATEDIIKKASCTKATTFFNLNEAFGYCLNPSIDLMKYLYVDERLGKPKKIFLMTCAMRSENRRLFDIILEFYITRVEFKTMYDVRYETERHFQKKFQTIKALFTIDEIKNFRNNSLWKSHAHWVADVFKIIQKHDLLTKSVEGQLLETIIRSNDKTFATNLENKFEFARSVLEEYAKLLQSNDKLDIDRDEYFQILVSEMYPENINILSEFKKRYLTEKKSERKYTYSEKVNLLNSLLTEGI